MTFPVARQLLAAERDRLLRDHFEEGDSYGCAGCSRASEVRLELLGLNHLPDTATVYTRPREHDVDPDASR